MLTRSYARLLNPSIISRTVVRASVATPVLLNRPFTSINTQLQQQQTQSSEPLATPNPQIQTLQQNSQSVPDLTPLKYEQNLYASIRVHNRPYLVTEGDEVILPFRMKHAEIGDILNFSDVTTIGSKNYTFHSEDSINPDLYSIKAVVLEKTKKPMYTKEITKRRNRHTRHVQVKHDLTVLRISEIKLNV